MSTSTVTPDQDSQAPNVPMPSTPPPTSVLGQTSFANASL